MYSFPFCARAACVLAERSALQASDQRACAWPTLPDAPPVTVYGGGSESEAWSAKRLSYRRYYRILWGPSLACNQSPEAKRAAA
eukprot:6184514-Pleurochrysis_carterae.AAC.1